MRPRPAAFSTPRRARRYFSVLKCPGFREVQATITNLHAPAGRNAPPCTSMHLHAGRCRKALPPQVPYPVPHLCGSRGRRSCAPKYAAEIALRQKGKKTCHHARHRVGPLHGKLMAAEIALGEVAESKPEAREGDRNQEMDWGESLEVGERVVANEQARSGSADHAGDPGVAKCTVPSRARHASQSCPQGQGTKSHRAYRKGDVNRDSGTGWHHGETLPLNFRAGHNPDWWTSAACHASMLLVGLRKVSNIGSAQATWRLLS